MTETASRSAGGECVAERWRRHAATRPDAEAVVHWSALAEPVRWTWAALLKRADAYAAWLAAKGVAAGQVCAIMARHHPEFYPLYAAIESLGAIPAVLAYPNPRLHPDKFRHGLEGMARRSGLDWLLTENEFLPLVAPIVAAAPQVRGILTPFDETPPDAAPPISSPASPDDPCLLQHSSGTTGLQKAIVLSHRAVLGHVERYAEAIGLTATDKVVSWLPLYHDMGLIAAFHLPLATGTPVVQLDPFEWVQAPSILLDAIAKERGTLCWLPNFAFNLLADRVSDEDLENADLSGLRLVVNCSEPVRSESFAKFAARFAKYGVRPTALAASYAMAETTFAVTQTIPGTVPAEVIADRASLAAGVVAPAVAGKPSRVCVSSGKVIRDCTLRVVGDDGAALADDRVGDLVVSSDSLFDGYRNYAEQTAAVLDGSWYRTGDTGFTRDGEVYVIGRKKDLIIVAGKNLYPEDIEDAVGGAPGVLPGRVVAFAVDDPENGTEAVAVICESDAAGTPGEAVVMKAASAAAAAVGVMVRTVHIVPPRWLIKSSAGKPSRAANRDRIHSVSKGP